MRQNFLLTLTAMGFLSAYTLPVFAQTPSPTAADFEIRLLQIEHEMRQLTGRIEELQFNLRRLQQDTEKQTKDVEFRLSELEHKIVPPAPPTPSLPPPPADQTLPNPPPESTLPSPHVNPFISAPTPPSPTAPVSTGDAQKDYDQAQRFIRQADYTAAEDILKSFMNRYPKHRLAGNAQYWLGETYYVRGQYAQAAVAFGDGFDKYPKNEKAPDNLLKLGLSLGQLKRTADACRTLGLVGTLYPKAKPAVLQHVAQERKKLKCR